MLKYTCREAPGMTPELVRQPKIQKKIDMKTQVKMTPQLGLKMRRLNNLAETITVILRKINGQTKVYRDSTLWHELNVHLEWVECELNQHDKSNLFEVAEYGCESWTAWTAKFRELCIEMISVDGYRDHARYLDADALRTPVTTAVASFGEFSRIAREEIEIVK